MITTDHAIIRRHELRRVARVQAGYLSRCGVCPMPSGSHRLLQARDVSPVGGIDVAAAVRFQPERNPDFYRLSRGDVLVVARGQDHTAYLVDADLPDVLASSVFYIIRPHQDIIQPAYLAWYLNQPDVQGELKSGSCGTGIGYIGRATIEHLPVMVPAPDVQRMIADIMGLWQQQRALQGRLDEKREQLIQALCRQTIRQEKE